MGDSNKNIKIEDKDKSTEYVKKQDEENKNISKKNANNEHDKNIKVRINYLTLF